MLARAAGAELADLEFVQFHPTAVVGIKGREGFLSRRRSAARARRSTTRSGERFIDELEPRDAVAKAIHALLVETGAPAVYLDMTAIDPARFPNVVEALREAGLDPATERIPVSPASHYVMGGITTDLDGRSTVAGLYAVGEAACTGLHGANRLASNSRQRVLRVRPPRRARRPRRPRRRGAARRAARRRARARAEPRDPPRDVARGRVGAHGGGTVAPVEDPHPLARLVAASALAREESRGAHARAEFPAPDPALDLPPQRDRGDRGAACPRRMDVSVHRFI